MESTIFPVLWVSFFIILSFKTDNSFTIFKQQIPSTETQIRRSLASEKNNLFQFINLFNILRKTYKTHLRFLGVRNIVLTKAYSLTVCSSSRPHSVGDSKEGAANAVLSQMEVSTMTVPRH